MVKVSIIVPVYNVEDYIIKCIDSLVNQTFKDIEVIVVNDGTKDNSISLIKEKYHDERIKIYERENHGAASARNFAITKATGDYLFFVDSDDFIDLNTIKEMYQEITKKKVDIVICDYYKLMEDNSKEHIKMIPHVLDNKKSSVIAMPGPVGKLIKKSLFDEYNMRFLENHYFEDNAIMPFVSAVAGKFSYIEKPFYYYLQRKVSSLNNQKYDPKWEDIFDSLDYLYSYFSKYRLLDSYHDELEYIYIEYLLHSPSLRFIKYQAGRGNIKRIGKIMKEKFPDWRRNKYYKLENIKYKIVCNVFYYNQLWLAKILLRK